MEDDTEQNAACRIAFQSALDKALGDYCQGGDAVEDATKPLFGLERGEGPDADDVLDEGLDASSTLEETRQWVHARTTQLIEKGGMDFDEASSRAWDEAAEERQPFPTDDSGDGLSLDDLSDSDGSTADPDGIGMDDPDLQLHDSPFGDV